MQISFTKMHGAGNDYIYFDCLGSEMDEPSDISRKLSRRHFSVGADGIVLILPSKIADARMRIFNSDGSEARMCGNAARCVGKWLFENKMIKKSHIRLETESGVRDLYLTLRDGRVELVTVDMGSASNIRESSLEVLGDRYRLTCVDVGNEHQVALCEDVDLLPLEKIGRIFEKNPIFDGGVNTEFCEIVAKNHLKVRTFERGSGETLSCGTGACAAAIAGIERGICEFGRQIKISMRGGELLVFANPDMRLFLSGGAETAFFGVVEI